jgi:hypothetical protein
MPRLDNTSGIQEGAQVPDRTGAWFDVAVLVESELTGTSARRMTELYQMKSTPLRYHLVRPLGDASTRTDDLHQQAERLMLKSVERMEALQVPVTGVVTDQEPVDAVLELVATMQCQEVVVVTGRHRLATILHRDLASQVRSRVDLPLVHLVA